MLRLLVVSFHLIFEGCFWHLDDFRYVTFEDPEYYSTV